MEKLRKYGEKPFNVAVIHGGPGAPGEMAPVAKELSSESGILEPLQTESSIKGQLQELRSVLKKHGDKSVILIGYSWGAWLSYILAAKYPSLVRKLILVGSGPFTEKYASEIMETRFNRLNKEEKREVNLLMEKLNDSNNNMEKDLARLGKLMSKADSFDPLPSNKIEYVDFQQEIYRKVWNEASELRKSGKLLEYGKQIECPVIAIHGDYDPHPNEGVKEPLSQVVEDFKLILLNNCGHTPWIERNAKNDFYRIIKKEIKVRGDTNGKNNY